MSDVNLNRHPVSFAPFWHKSAHILASTRSENSAGDAGFDRIQIAGEFLQLAGVLRLRRVHQLS